MEFDIQKNGDLWVVKLLADRLDAAQAVRFKEGLKSIVDDGANAMLLDLSQVKFLDSSGLGAIVAHLKYMGVERRFEICGLTSTVAKVFKLTRMDTVFKVHASVNDALNVDAASGF